MLFQCKCKQFSGPSGDSVASQQEGQDCKRVKLMHPSSSLTKAHAWIGVGPQAHQHGRLLLLTWEAEQCQLEGNLIYNKSPSFVITHLLRYYVILLDSSPFVSTS